MSSDRAVQIVKFNKAKKVFELDINLLRSVLTQNGVGDSDISVISISGAVRKGKSFLLSFFLRYLNAEYVQNNSSNWLGGEDTPLTGFAWRGGSSRHTTGIWIWNKIFTKTLPTGKKVGVMLMDTQGIFDSLSTMQENISIFSLSMMMSSVQIFNLFNNIQQDDLNHLQLFTEYGNLAASITKQKAFQQLLVLVRDWNFSYEHAYGSSGGQALLNERLANTADHQEELIANHNQIRASFEKISCFLMPHPGKEVAVAQNFNGALKSIDAEFKSSLQQLVPMILSPGNLQIKKINGQPIKASNIPTYFESYLNVFKSGKMPTAQTILGATIEALNLSASVESMEYYQTTMNAATSDAARIYSSAQLQGIQNKTVAESIKQFNEKTKMGNHNDRQKFITNMNNDFHRRFLLYLTHNDSKRIAELSNRINALKSQLQSGQQQTQQKAAEMVKLNTDLVNLKAQHDAAMFELAREWTNIFLESQHLTARV